MGCWLGEGVSVFVRDGLVVGEDECEADGVAVDEGVGELDAVDEPLRVAVADAVREALGVPVEVAVVLWLRVCETVVLAVRDSDRVAVPLGLPVRLAGCERVAEADGVAVGDGVEEVEAVSVALWGKLAEPDCDALAVGLGVGVPVSVGATLGVCVALRVTA